LRNTFVFSLILGFARVTSVFFGSSIGSYLSGITPYRNRKNMIMWMCLVTQAGVSLGVASELRVLFPSFGRALQTTLITVVLVNQMCGPLLFRAALRQTDEAGKAPELAVEDNTVMPTAVIIGYSKGAMATSIRFMHERWSVMLLCSSEVKKTFFLVYGMYIYIYNQG
jgi:hypothetical protein